MPSIVANGVELSYEEQGEGAETIVFSHSYLLDWSHFEPQIEKLSLRFRCIAYDHREHGKSERVARPYRMDDLVEDAIALIDALELGPCHWVGLSTGGFVGMRLAVRRPDLLRSLVLMDTSADPERLRKRLQYRAMFAVLRAAGYGPLLGQVMRIMFAKKIRTDPRRKGELDRWRSVIAGREPAERVRFGSAIFGRGPFLDALAEIAVPTLIVAGAEDKAIAAGSHERMAHAVPDARMVTIPDAGHISTIEEPEAVNRALEDFYAGIANGE